MIASRDARRPSRWLDRTMYSAERFGRTIWRINSMTKTSRFGRASLFAAAAAGLLGFLAGGATWARPADAHPAAARTAAAPAHVAAARAAAAPALDFSQTLPPGQPSAAIADTEYSTRLYG